jgi:hypothetical protein
MQQQKYINVMDADSMMKSDESLEATLILWDIILVRNKGKKRIYKMQWMRRNYYGISYKLKRHPR